MENKMNSNCLDILKVKNTALPLIDKILHIYNYCIYLKIAQKYIFQHFLYCSNKAATIILVDCEFTAISYAYK